MRVDEVGKQDNAINLYSLNFLGTVMLRPLLVTLGGVGRDFSSLALPVHLSIAAKLVEMQGVEVE
jgi:hypothetical protein